MEKLLHSLELLVYVYSMMRRVFWIIQVLLMVSALAFVIWSALYGEDRSFFYFGIVGSASLIIALECFLYVCRFVIKSSLDETKDVIDADIDHYLNMQYNLSGLRNEILKGENDPTLEEKSKKFIEKVKSGDDTISLNLLSAKINYWRSVHAKQKLETYYVKLN